MKLLATKAAIHPATDRTVLIPRTNRRSVSRPEMEHYGCALMSNCSDIGATTGALSIGDVR